MPPKAKLGPKETAPALKALAESLTAADQKRQQERGRTVIRRLNRVEFENTLRDLLDLPWLEVKDLLPDDGRDGGYTRSAAALDVSPIFLAKVGEAIDLALDAATAKYSIPPEIFREKLYANQQYDFKVLMSGGDAVMLTKDQKYDSSRFPMPSATNADGPFPKGKWGFGGKYAGLGEAERAGVFKEPSTVGMTRTFGEAFQGRMGFAPIHSGRYRIGVSAWSYWWDKGEIKPAPRSGAVGVYLGGNLLGTFDAPSLKPTYTEIVVESDADGERLHQGRGHFLLGRPCLFQPGADRRLHGPWRGARLHHGGRPAGGRMAAAEPSASLRQPAGRAAEHPCEGSTEAAP